MKWDAKSAVEGSGSGASQAGFTLLETLVATALSTSLALAIVSAVLASMHATARVNDQAELTDHALNILSDLREATAYDTGVLAKVGGRTALTTFPANASPNARMLTATVSVSRAANSTTPVVATVTVSEDGGASVTETQALFVEAPAPGSVIDAATPTPGPLGP